MASDGLQKSVPAQGKCCHRLPDKKADAKPSRHMALIGKLFSEPEAQFVRHDHSIQVYQCNRQRPSFQPRQK